MSIEQKIAEILAESKKLDEFKVHGTEGMWLSSNRISSS